MVISAINSSPKTKISVPIRREEKQQQQKHPNPKQQMGKSYLLQVSRHQQIYPLRCLLFSLHLQALPIPHTLGILPAGF